MLSQPMNQMLKPTRKFNQKSNIFSLIKEKKRGIVQCYHKPKIKS